MMTIDEMIAVLEHAKNGGKVQARNRCNYSTEWIDFEEGCKPAWDFPSCDYRAKPLLIYAEIMADGLAIQFSTTEFKATNGGTVRKFAEVAE